MMGTLRFAHLMLSTDQWAINGYFHNLPGAGAERALPGCAWLDPDCRSGQDCIPMQSSEIRIAAGDRALTSAGTLDAW